MTIHAANPAKSTRLQAALRLLQARGSTGATTLELYAMRNDMAVHSSIAELRANGYRIDCQYDHMSETHRKIYRYFLRQ